MATTPAKSRLYRTERTLTRTLRVAYPSARGRVVLRTEKDWDRSLEPVALSEDGEVSTFEVEADQPFLYFKPCLVESGTTHWAVGPNKLLLMTEKDVRVSYPHFFGPEVGRFSSLLEIDSSLLGRDHKIRGYLPPGYDENTLSRFSGASTCRTVDRVFPERPSGTDLHWSTYDRATSSGPGRRLGLPDPGIHSADRMTEYTKPVRALRPLAGRGWRLVSRGWEYGATCCT